MVDVRLPPTAKDGMSLRVEHLARTRTDVMDSSAAEIRRISRDLHDGAQARLLAMDMESGSALLGIQRQLATFDSTLGISSPIGGPTTPSLQIPGTLTVMP